ncbi:MAG: carboxypeptidase regulatory-like domain-containing protein [Bacteroidales bacterium]|nr:carboxypeptidase regulatory-like domain-containing protein [Bacteroidales bacterium]
MKTLTSILCGILLPFLLTAQGYKIVPVETIKEIAGRNAQALWGDVYPAEPIPYYGQDDEIVAWQFNYSIGKPFPESEKLVSDCGDYAAQKMIKEQWGSRQFGNILIGARDNLPVVHQYSQQLSPEFALGHKLRKMLIEAFGDQIPKAGKTYYLGGADIWQEYSALDQSYYFCASPVGRVLSETEFRLMKASAEPFCLTGDFGEEWINFENGYDLGTRGDVYISDHEVMPYYDWSYGCGPTAMVMLLGYHDYRSLNSIYKYANLITHHFERWDPVDVETDFNVPEIQKLVAFYMGTDSTSSGFTHPHLMDNGVEYIANTLKGYNFSASNYRVTPWTKINPNIDNNRPLIGHLWNHFITIIGYQEGTDIIHTHWTWQPEITSVNRYHVLGVTVVVPGGSSGNAIQLVTPFGDPRYNRDGQGETFRAGNYHEIRWLSDNVPGSTVDISYSLDGGHSFTKFVTNLPNTGFHNWFVPSHLSSTKARIRVDLYTPTKEYAGADGSYGNFMINSGGSIAYLEHSQFYLNDHLTKYYRFEHSVPSDNPKWGVVGTYHLEEENPWTCELWDEYFLNMLSSSTLTDSPQNIVVLDGNHLLGNVPYGMKIRPLSEVSQVLTQFQKSTEVLNWFPGVEMIRYWNNNDLVQIYDLQLNPGQYYIKLEHESVGMSLDMALFGSTSGNYFKSLSEADYISSNAGYAPESFIVNITTADRYGLCVFARERISGQFGITISDAFIWTGAVSHNWHNGNNWTGLAVPGAGDKVTIPPVSNYPIITAGAAFCGELNLLQSGRLQITTNNLTVSNDVFLNGLLEIDDDWALICNGNVSCMQHGAIMLDADAGIQVKKDWTFELYSNIVSNIGYVSMIGSEDSKIYVKSGNSWFPKLTIAKTDASVTFAEESSTGKAPVSSYPLLIKKEFTIFPNAHFIGTSTQNTIIRDVFLTYPGSQYTFNEGAAVFEMPGSDSYSIGTPTGSYFNDVDIDFFGTLDLLSFMDIRGDLDLKRGTLQTNGYNIKIRGSWNRSDNSTFQHGNARVIFCGSGDQTVKNTNFWILEIDNSLWVSFPETTVTCQFYDWTKGVLMVNGGTFSAAGMMDPGIYGGVFVSSGELNLRQDPGEYMDLNGDLLIIGGTVKITGGQGPSFWPWAANASITMSGGVLDFYDVGIQINNSPSYTFTENITGGTIRTRGNLLVQRTDFNPSGGTFEFYGIEDNATVAVNPASNLYNLLLTKATEGKDKGIVKKLTASGTLDINGDFILERGIFEAPPTMKVAGNFINLKSQANFTELTGHVILDGNSNIIINNSETFFKLTVDKASPGSVLINNNLDLTVSNKLTVENGHMTFNPGSALFLDGSYESNYGAEVRFQGTEADNILVSSASKANYAFDVIGGGIGAIHTIFENMDNDGIRLLSYVDPEMAFHHCTFRNGAPGGTLVTWNQGATITVEDAVFPANTTGSLYNVTKTSDNGNVFFHNATGAFAGAAFESDPFSRVHWEYVPPFELPFSENWTSGDFTTKRWVKTADNWVVSATLGNAAPAATFHFWPRIYNYSADLRSHYLNAKNYSQVFLKFDLRYVNYSSTTLEQLQVRVVLNNDDFINVATYNNAAGSFGFISESFNISSIAAGNEIRIYFRAFGQDSNNINDWIIDNIQVYGTPIPPATLSGKVSDDVTSLPLENALITLVGTSYSALSQSDGQYTINNILPGIYDVTATAAGYEPSTSEGIEFLSGETVTKDFPLQPIPPAYCTEGLYSIGCVEGDGLNYFELNTILNLASGCSENGYGDFTALLTDIARGYDHAVFFASGFSDQHLSLWLDFNDNYEFEASERLLTDFILYDAGETYQATIHIPAGAPLGEHRLRVRTNWNAPGSDPCALYEYGEAEDYTVNITNDLLFGLLYATLTDDVSANPVNGAMVEIEGTSLYGITEEEGICLIEYIVPGTYNVHISASGYQSLTINDFMITGNESNYLTATLIPALPDNLYLEDITILTGQFECFAATQTIVVAGSGTIFIVEPGAEAELVAGENIIMLPGTRVFDGGYLMARITVTDDYCSNPESIISAVIDPTPTEMPSLTGTDKSFFRVYPNPTTGRFTLELTGGSFSGAIEVEAYDLIGKVILKTALPASQSHEFDFSLMQPGVYIMKVIHGSDAGFVKLIRQ